MPSSAWPYRSPGIPDDQFERLPGIPMTKREPRLLLIAQLRLQATSVLWDVGSGTGTIPVETGLLCPEGHVVAIERDEEVVKLIKTNCDHFGVTNVEVIQGSAPECLVPLMPAPDRVCLEGGRNVREILQTIWDRLLPQGRVVATAASLKHLYTISEAFGELQACNVEVVQSVINRLETRGNHQLFTAVDPIFILSGEKRP